jgi:hypothetical protein
MKIRKRTIALFCYFVLIIVPIYWMLNMSLRSNSDILSTFSLYPANITFANYIKVFTDPTWYSGYINAMIYVSLNTIMSLAFALPAAYAFSRYKFIGDGQMFFWLLTNRMAPPAVFLLPYFQLYSTVNLIDTHIAVALAHCLFNVPLAVWILEGFMSGIPKEIDETAFIDGYSFPTLFYHHLHPADPGRRRRDGLFLLHVLVGRAPVRPHADRHRGQADRGDHDPHHQRHRSGLGPAGRQWYPHHRSGRTGHLVRPQPPCQGFRTGPRIRRFVMSLEWMYWTVPTAIFLHHHLFSDLGHAGLGTGFADHRAARLSPGSHHQGHPLFHRIAGYGLHSSGLAGAHRFQLVAGDAHFIRVDRCRNALGVACRCTPPIIVFPEHPESAAIPALNVLSIARRCAFAPRMHGDIPDPTKKA